MFTLRAATTATLAFAAASITAVAPTAHAAPDGFPDLSAFTPVDPEPYISRNGRGASVLAFHTVTGISCSWYASSDINLHVVASCDGNIPGIPADTAERTGCPGVAVPRRTVGEPYELTSSGFPCPTTPTSLLLYPGQKITETHITCAVGTDNMLACIDDDQNHGFVLQPSGSFAF